MTDDEFEWDDAKAASNLKKHEVSFEDAREIFKDAFSVELPNADIEDGEHRFSIIGMAVGRLLYVAYTERRDRIRIISARKANKREQYGYYHHQTAE
jgi:uncharacterized DUF497 family protein